MSRKLSQSQQIFLQRLMAAQVVSDDQAKKIWGEVSRSAQDGGRERNLNETLSAINKSLVPNFALEIKSVSLDLSGCGERILYHAVVNKDADDVAKAAATPTFEKTPHDLAFVRLVLESLIEKFNQSIEETSHADDEEDTNNRKKKKRSASSRQGSGCSSSLSRIDLVNLRLELPEPHKSKLSIQQVEKLLTVLELEGWLAAASQRDDDEEGGRQSTSGVNKRKSASGGDKTARAKNLQIGPRAYLELPDLLKDLGLDRNHIPQVILHA